MILFTIRRSSIDAVSNHVENVKQRVLVGIRLGMRDGIRALARAEVEAVSGHRRTGLLERILGRGGRVIESGEQISAVYRPRYAGKQEHYWLQYGVKNPAVEGKLMQINVAGGTVYRMSRKGFETPGQPFFFATAEGFREQFFEILKARMDEAMRA
jgi:hypothetical protein